MGGERNSGIPVVLIAVNGGPGTLETIAEGVESNFAVVVADGSGRACDAVAAVVRKAQQVKISTDKSPADAILMFSARGESGLWPPTVASLMDRNDAGTSTDFSEAWYRLLDEVKDEAGKTKIIAFMDRILRRFQLVTVFNADEEDVDMDIFILRAILNYPGVCLKRWLD